MGNNVLDILNEIANRYPADLTAAQVQDIPRIAFNLHIALFKPTADRGTVLGEMEICDLGGGVGLFSVACAALGAKRSVLVEISGIRLTGAWGIRYLICTRATVSR